MSKFWKNEQYKKLEEYWYKKLEKDGFNDVESSEDHLKMWTSTMLKKSTPTWRAKEHYYYMATQFLNDYKFESNRERIIWEYHANGISVRDIVVILKKVRIKLKKDAVWLIIKKLQAAMKRLYLVKAHHE